MRTLFIKEKYLQQLLLGNKTLEGRVGYDSIKRIKVGDIVSLNKRYKFKVINIRKYSSFKEALDNENYKLLIPDARSKDEALKVYNNLYPFSKQEKLGVYILELSKT